MLARSLDEQEFLSPFGVRSLSKYHEAHPYHFHCHDQIYTISYVPGESDTDMFGGNSNWRGPVWMPANLLIIQALLSMHTYYGDDFQVECPTGSGCFLDLYQVAKVISCRLMHIFVPDQNGRRPVFGGPKNFRTTHIGETICCSTNIFMAIMVRDLAPVIKPVGLVRWLPY